jgi:hypothetical protein
MPQAAAKAQPQAAKEDKATKEKPKSTRTNFSALYPEDAPLKLLVETNPKKEGSKSRTRFDSYFNAKTVGDAMAGDNGVTYQDIVYDIGHGFIKVG